MGLAITSEVNIKRTELFDVLLDLERNSYRPYRKPNSTPLYIHSSSNHPRNIKKEIPKMVASRISKLSCTEDVFKEEIPTYQNALKASGYKEYLKFVQNVARNQEGGGRGRRRQEKEIK